MSPYEAAVTDWFLLLLSFSHVLFAEENTSFNLIRRKD